MATLRDAIRSILDRAADDIVAAVYAQLGGVAPVRATVTPERRAKPGAGGRSRLTDEARAEMVKSLTKAIRSAGEEGASRKKIMTDLGWDEGTFTRIKEAAKGEIRMKGNRRTALYFVK
jgi:hypothetical protein